VTQVSSIHYIEFTSIYHVTVESIALRNRNKGSLPDETRHDDDDVNEDGGKAAGGKGDSKYDAARRSTSFVNCLRSTHRDSGKLYNTMRRDVYDVNEDGGEAAGGKDDSKYDTARRSMSFVNC